MIELVSDDVGFIASRLPKDVMNLLKNRGPLFLAGGFIRSTISGEKPNDIDLFGCSKEILHSIAKDLTLSREGAKLHETENAFTVLTMNRLPVQFIHRWVFDAPGPCCLSFDFTIAQAALWHDGEDWRSIAADRFYTDLAAKRLVYTSPIRNEDAGGSMLRVRKFLQRGYNIQAPALAAVMARVFQDVRKEYQNSPTVPTEAEVATSITALLREVDPLIVIDGMDPINEHQVAGA